MRHTLVAIFLFPCFLFSVSHAQDLTKEKAQDSLAFLNQNYAHTLATLMTNQMGDLPAYKRFEAFQRKENPQHLSPDSLQIIISQLKEARDEAAPKVANSPEVMELNEQIRRMKFQVYWEFATPIDRLSYEEKHYPALTGTDQNVNMFLDIALEDVSRIGGDEPSTRSEDDPFVDYFGGSEPKASEGMGNGMGIKLYRDLNAYVDTLQAWCATREVDAKSTLDEFRPAAKVEDLSWVKHTFKNGREENRAALVALKQQALHAKEAAIRLVEK